MSFRAITEEKAFRHLVLMGVVAAVTNLITTYLKTGQVDLLVSTLQFVVVVIVAVPLVAYWNYMERRAEAE